MDSIPTTTKPIELNRFLLKKEVRVKRLLLRYQTYKEMFSPHLDRIHNKQETNKGQIKATPTPSTSTSTALTLNPCLPLSFNIDDIQTHSLHCKSWGNNLCEMVLFVNSVKSSTL